MGNDNTGRATRAEGLMLTDDQKRMLAQSLPREFVKTRDHAGKPLSYVEGGYVIERLNTVFGYDGWSCEPSGPITLIPGDRPIAYVPVTLRAGGVAKGDVGVGLAAVNKGDSIETALKSAFTDGLKRCARMFGPSLGLALYDKEQTDVGYSFACQDVVAKYDAATTMAEYNAARDAGKAAWPTLADDERSVVNQAIARAKERLAPQPPPTGTDGTPRGLPAQSAPATPGPARALPQATVTNVRPAPETPRNVAPATPAAPTAPRRSEGAALCLARIEMARGLSTVVAAIRGATFRDDERAAVWSAAEAAAERLGAIDNELRRRFDESSKVRASRDQWATAAAVLVDVDEACDAEDLGEMRRRHAATVATLPGDLVAGVKRATDERARALGAPTIGSVLLRRARAAASQSELNTVYNDASAQAAARAITQETLNEITATLNERANAIQVAA